MHAMRDPGAAPRRGASRQRLSGYGLRRALRAGIQRVIAQRDELNRINVFPVPDGDTGTNLAFTLGAMLGAIGRPRVAHAGDVLRDAASEAIDGARGNSGAILAQFFQGLSERLTNEPRLSPESLAQAANDGARLAREALAEPREGTILSVIAAFANGWMRAIEGGARDFRSGFAAALARAKAALDATPQQLSVLRSAGVVDAGGQGFVDLLEGIDDFIRCGRSALAREQPAEAADHHPVFGEQHAEPARRAARRAAHEHGDRHHLHVERGIGAHGVEQLRQAFGMLERARAPPPRAAPREREHRAVALQQVARHRRERRRQARFATRFLDDQRVRQPVALEHVDDGRIAAQHARRLRRFAADLEPRPEQARGEPVRPGSARRGRGRRGVGGRGHRDERGSPRRERGAAIR